MEHAVCAVAAHRRPSTADEGCGRRHARHVALGALAVAAACACAAVADGGRGDRRGYAMLAWLNAHGDGQLGYSGLRTTVPSEVLYKSLYSDTPLSIPGLGPVAPNPMPYTGVIHRAWPMVAVRNPDIRMQTTTSFSDSQGGLVAAAQGAPQLLGSPLTVMAGAATGAIVAPVTQPSFVAAAFHGAQAGQPPAYMHPQFLGVVPTTVSSVGYATGVSGAGNVPQLGYMPPTAYSSVGKLQRGFVPIRVAMPQLAGLPKLTGNRFVKVGPQMAYDPNNVNAGIVEGLNDVNQNLGLPAIPPLSPMGGEDESGVEEEMQTSQNATSTASESSSDDSGSHQQSEHDVQNPRGGDNDSVESKRTIRTPASIILLSSQAVPVCNSDIVVIDKQKAASNVKSPCISLSEAKMILGASGYAALEELVDAEAVLEAKNKSVLVLPEGAHIQP
jgi:hypothetical protein